MIRLRPYRKTDAEKIVTWISDEAMFRKWSADRYDRYPINAEDINLQYAPVIDTDSFFPYTAVEGNEVIGHLIMRWLDDGHSVLRFGFIIVDTSKRGKGYGLRMLEQAEKTAFELLGAEKVTLGFFENNPSALSCYRKAGFTETGDRHEILLCGEMWTCIEMEINRETYAGRNLSCVEHNGGSRKEYERFLGIVRRLRAPDGCPWDREQTHESLRNNLIEESYEVAESLDKADTANLCEELGDCLLIIFMQAVIAEEKGEFNLEQVLKGIADKMVFRHPHVFGDNKEIKTSQDILDKWESLKAEEKKEKTLAESITRIPKALPANIRAAKVQKKASKVGMDFESYEQALSKVFEELEELEEARSSGNTSEIYGEYGDLMFSIVNISRFLGIDAENSLTNAVEKFINRIVAVEGLATEAGRHLNEMTPAELDELWKKVK